MANQKFTVSVTIEMDTWPLKDNVSPGTAAACFIAGLETLFRNSERHRGARVLNETVKAVEVSRSLSGSASSPPLEKTIMLAFTELRTPENLVSIAALRRHPYLAHLTREEQDAGVALERNVTVEELNAGIREAGQIIGYLVRI